MDRLAAQVQGLGSPEEILAEALTWTLEQLPQEPYLGILLQPARRPDATARMVDDNSVAYGRVFLARLDIDWAGLGFDEADLDDFAELMMRLFTSYLNSPDLKRDREGQRQFFLRWLGGALRARAAVGTGEL